MSATHSDLVAAASKWLQKKCAVVVTEIATTGEEPDALGWQGTHSTLVECKASRADYLRDKAKAFRQREEFGLGQARYFCAPRGMLDADELPPAWGLLEFEDGKLRVAKVSDAFGPNTRQEVRILLSCLRRLGKTALVGCSIRHYTIETRNRATLGVLAEEEVA
jgi:hypothetical protein